jgi:hypothetical protein
MIMLLLHHIEQSMQAKRKVIRPATKSQIEKEDEDLGTCRILVVLALLVLLLSSLSVTSDISHFPAVVVQAGTGS